MGARRPEGNRHAQAVTGHGVGPCRLRALADCSGIRERLPELRLPSRHARDGAVHSARGAGLATAHHRRFVQLATGRAVPVPLLKPPIRDSWPSIGLANKASKELPKKGCRFSLPETMQTAGG